NHILQQNGQIPKQTTIITDVQAPIHHAAVVLEPQPPQQLSQPQIQTVAMPLATAVTSAPAKQSAAAALPAEGNNSSSNAHKSEKKYSCEACGKFFSTIYN